MNDLTGDVASLVTWFDHGGGGEGGVEVVRLSEAESADFSNTLKTLLRRCYVSDGRVESLQSEHGRTRREILAAQLPDPDSTMSGDFAEIVTFLFVGSTVEPQPARGPKKWRLKQDRTKPAPRSDVVHFLAPEWPRATERDGLVCVEVKAKATHNNSWHPIDAAILDAGKDRTSRLAETLVWLKERALTTEGGLGSVTVELIERFLEAADNPQASRSFRAVAVISQEMVEGEIASLGLPLPDGITVQVISVPRLKETYEACYAAALDSFEEEVK